jgi:hypothetical protein
VIPPPTRFGDTFSHATGSQIRPETCSWSKFHSSRRAIIGSTRAARRAGIQQGQPHGVQERTEQIVGHRDGGYFAIAVGA